MLHQNLSASGSYETVGVVGAISGHDDVLLLAASRLQGATPEAFEIYLRSATARKIESKDGRVETLTQATDAGLAIRVIKDRRMGFSFTTDLSRDAVTRAAEAALAIAKVMPKDEDLALTRFSASHYPAVNLRDEKGLAVPVARKIALALDLERRIRDSDKRITQIRQASLSETDYRIAMLDHSGEPIRYDGTLFSASVTCKAEQNGDAQMGGDFDFAHDLASLDFDAVARRSVETATELLGAGTAPTARCPAVLRNSVVADLLEFLAGSFLAESIDKGRSVLKGRQGSRIFSEKLTLIHDGLLPGGYGTAPFDAEGVPSHKTVLVDGGFFERALYDLQYAKIHGAKPSACASRGIKSPPAGSVANLYFKKGRKKPESLLSGISRGVLITDLMGVHTANPITGDFSLGASGLWIENGVISRPVKGFAVAGNVIDLLGSVVDVASDLRFFGSVGAPSIVVSELSVGGA